MSNITKEIREFLINLDKNKLQRKSIKIEEKINISILREIIEILKTEEENPIYKTNHIFMNNFDIKKVESLKEELKDISCVVLLDDQPIKQCFSFDLLVNITKGEKIDDYMSLIGSESIFVYILEKEIILLNSLSYLKEKLVDLTFLKNDKKFSIKISCDYKDNTYRYFLIKEILKDLKYKITGKFYHAYYKGKDKYIEISNDGPFINNKDIFKSYKLINIYYNND